jgi:hypothetical protein
MNEEDCLAALQVHGTVAAWVCGDDAYKFGIAVLHLIIGTTFSSLAEIGLEWAIVLMSRLEQ